jgi:hypothetical protein
MFTDNEIIGRPSGRGFLSKDDRVYINKIKTSINERSREINVQEINQGFIDLFKEHRIPILRVLSPGDESLALLLNINEYFILPRVPLETEGRYTFTFYSSPVLDNGSFVSRREIEDVYRDYWRRSLNRIRNEDRTFYNDMILEEPGFMRYLYELKKVKK